MAFQETLDQAVAARDKRDYDKAMMYFSAAIGIAEDDDQKAKALQQHGVTLRNMGRNNAAETVFVEARQLAMSTLDLELRGRVCRDYGMLKLDQGEFDEAEELLRQSRVYLRENEIEKAATVGFIGRLYFAQGDTDTALQYMAEADDELRNCGNDQYELNNLIWLMKVSGLARLVYAARCMRLAMRTGTYQRGAEALILLVGGNKLHARAVSRVK